MGICQGNSSQKGDEVAIKNLGEDAIISEKLAKSTKHPEANLLSKEYIDKIKENQRSISKLIKLQAWIKGMQSRKQNSNIVIKFSTGMIKYISEKLAAPSEASLNVERKLGPYIFDWSKDSNLELKKDVNEETGDIYIGYWNKQIGKKEGYGQQISLTGVKYEGMWKDSMPEGEGRYIYENGDYYIGNRAKGKASGKGTYVTNEGDSYIGEWLDDVYNGKGKEVQKDKSMYEGNFVTGKKEGKGKFVWPDGSAYEGDFVANSICGEGEYKSADGTEYKGQWKDNKRNGKGVFKFTDGKVYEGNFVNDLRHGYGVMTW